MRDLQNKDMPSNEAFKKARHNLIKSIVFERQRHTKITVGVFSSSAPPSPPLHQLICPYSGILMTRTLSVSWVYDDSSFLILF